MKKLYLLVAIIAMAGISQAQQGGGGGGAFGDQCQPVGRINCSNDDLNCGSIGMECDAFSACSNGVCECVMHDACGGGVGPAPDQDGKQNPAPPQLRSQLRAFRLKSIQFKRWK
jgi:hypothetical protein